MTTPTWTPDSLLFLTFVAMAIVYLILGEMIEARRARPVPVRVDAKPSAREASRLRALPKAAREAWRIGRAGAARSIRSAALD